MFSGICHFVQLLFNSGEKAYDNISRGCFAGPWESKTINRGRSMEFHIVALEELYKNHDEIGKSLYRACNMLFFPADILAFSVLERSLQLLKGFCLLMRNEGYVCAVPLLRMQLDSGLRFSGIVSMDDPHGTAQLVMNGKRLSKIKGMDGKSMTDECLVKRLSEKNPQIQVVYDAACSYVHFSREHFALLLARCKKISEDGNREICIGDDDAHIPMENKLGLINDFNVITKAVLNLLEHWCSYRHNYGDISSLRERCTQRL
jgi:hypothetical protein